MHKTLGVAAARVGSRVTAKGAADGILGSRDVVAQSYFGGLPIDGIRCDRTEGASEHVHASLQLFESGRAVAVPANIGMPQAAGCLYWIHTHSGDG